MAEINVQDLTVKTKEGNTNTYEFVQPDGYYQEMTVGDAEQLVATVGVTDKVPYLFRTSGGSADIGNRETDEITGGSLVWNQLAYNAGPPSSRGGVTITGSDSYFTMDGTATASTSAAGWFYLSTTRINIANHVIYESFKLVEGSVDGVVVFKSNGAFSNMALGGERIAKASTQSNSSLYFENETIFTNAKLRVQAIDLTAMFGSTIADYVYSLETATAGAGVAWFKKLFPKPYYAYNANEMRHVSGVSTHRMVGFNAYNPETGTAVLLGGNQYQITGAYTALSYTDIGGNVETITPDSNGLFTPSANGTLTVTGGNSTDTCVHLVWSGTHNGEYEPYEVHEYALDDSLTLRGVPKLDANNELYYDGDTYASDGTVTRRYGIVDLGTLNWTGYTSGTNPIFYASVSGAKVYANNDAPSCVCGNYPIGRFATSRSNLASYLSDKTCSWISGGTNFVIRDDSYTTQESFKAAMSGVMLIYELATPTTETAEPYTNPQIVNDWGTEEYVTDSIVPVGHTTFYPVNNRDKLQHLMMLSPLGDGFYLIQQIGTQMYLVPFSIPRATGEDGTYVLKATVSGGTPTYAWVLEE